MKQFSPLVCMTEEKPPRDLSSPEAFADCSDKSFRSRFAIVKFSCDVLIRVKVCNLFALIYCKCQ